VRRTLIAALAGLLLSGCAAVGSSAHAVNIDWDVSRSRTMDDVHWLAKYRDLSSIEIGPPVGAVHIRFPGGQAFTAADGIERIGLDREGNSVSDVAIFSGSHTTEEAYRLAITWISAFKLPRKPIDEWYAQQHGPVQHRTATPLTYTPAGQTVGPHGPEPSLKLLDDYSGDARPLVVSLDFFWVPRRHA